MLLCFHSDVKILFPSCSGVPRNFVRAGVQQIQLRTEDRENGDVGAVAIFGHVAGRLLFRYYDLYQRLQIQFYVLLMMGAMDTRNM